MIHLNRRKRLPKEGGETSEPSAAYDSRHPVLHRVVLSPAGGLIRIPSIRDAVPIAPTPEKAATAAPPQSRKP